MFVVKKKTYRTYFFCYMIILFCDVQNQNISFHGEKKIKLFLTYRVINMNTSLLYAYNISCSEVVRDNNNNPSEKRY